MKSPSYLSTTSSIAALALALTTVIGCERAAPVEAEPSAPTFSEVQTQIFSQSCAFSGCHTGSSPPQGLDLSEGNAYDNLVDVASNEVPELDRVEPGNPDDSYLIIKLTGNSRMAEGTAQMPFGSDPLSEDKIELVRQWIQEGAPEN